MTEKSKEDMARATFGGEATSPRLNREPISEREDRLLRAVRAIMDHSIGPYTSHPSGLAHYGLYDADILELKSALAAYPKE